MVWHNTSAIAGRGVGWYADDNGLSEESVYLSIGAVMPQSASPLPAKGQELLDMSDSLSTLNAAAAWRLDAEAFISRLLEEAEALDSAALELNHKAGELRSEVKGKSIFGWLFKSNDEKQVAASLKSAVAASSSCRVIAEQLQSKVDSTPATTVEKAEMLKELKMRKKELQLEKRELTAHMKNIRTEARQKSSDAATSFSALIGGSKYTATERRNIRAEKERALAPHEDAKAAIERRVLAVDREILRVESLS